MLKSLYVNQVLHKAGTDEFRRILYISNEEQFVYFIYLNQSSGIPLKVSLQQLEDEFLQGILEIAEDKWIALPSDKESSIERRDKLWELLGEALQKEPDIYVKPLRADLLHAVSEKSGISITNLYRYLRRYWQYGKDKDAFFPDDASKGGKGKERLYSKKPGRKAGDTAAREKILTEDDIKNFETYIRRGFLKPNGSTLKQAYRDMIRGEYSEHIKDESGTEKIVAFDRGQIPTYRQFYYWYSKHRDRQKETETRKGTKEYELKERPIVGKADYGMNGPGSEYQIDATIADVYLVSRFNRKNIIGRPVVYFVKDVFSRLVTGLYVGLEGPSWMGMAMALYNSFTDKVAFCHSYGLEISEEEWPCHHVPFSIRGDRGELESLNANRLVDELGIRVSNTPPYRGDLKPIVERHFRILNDTCVKRLPGNVKPDMSQRGSHDYRLDAVLDLYQFTRIIIHNTLIFNSLTLKNLEPSEAMMRADIDLTPLSLWNWGMQSGSGALKTITEEKARYVLLPRDKCEITRSGVKFKKLFYTGRIPIEQHWFDTAGRTGSYSKVASYDPRDSSAIYVWHDEGKDPVRVELCDWEIRFRGKAIDECMYEQEVIDLKKAAREKKDEDAIMTADQFVESVVAEAAALKPDVSGMTKTERVSRIVENRAAEKEENRKQESMVREPEKVQTEPSQSESLENQAEKPRRKRELTKLEKLLWEIEDDE